MTTSNSLTSFVCACCDRAIVDPVFVGGKTYGRQCAKKVLGMTIKKDKAVFVKATRISVDMENYLPVATYEIEGLGKFLQTAERPIGRGIELDDMLPVNAIQILNSKGFPRFKSLSISLADKILIYTDKYGKETQIAL